MALREKGILIHAFGAALACFGSALGCGSEDEDGVRGSAASGGTSAGTSGDAAAGTSAGGTAAGSGGATGGVGGATGGSGGTTGGGGSAGIGAVYCSGEWGPSREVLAAPASRYISSPTLSPDELEILYVQDDRVAGGIGVHRSVRDSVAAVFPPGQRVTELDAAVDRCFPFWISGIDLSGDGLTIYMGCYGDLGSGPLLVARRTQISAPFTLDAQEYGTVGTGLSVSPDELAVFSDGYVVPNCCKSPLMFTRSSTSARFGSGVKVPGLETATLVTPEPSPDGLWFFGAVNVDVIAAQRERLNAPFGAPGIVVAGEYEPHIYYAIDPEISSDCRRLYYVKRIDANPGVQELITSIRVVER